MAAYDVDVELERLHWTLDIKGTSHILDLLPGVLGTVAIDVDGRHAGEVRKPAPQRPWVEATVVIDGEPVIVAVRWHQPMMHTDVFVGGRSVRYGRTLERARSVAPPPASNYEAWIGSIYRFRIPTRPAILTRGMAVVAVISLVALGVILIWMTRPSGILLAAIAGAAMIALFTIWWVSWHAVATRVHLALLDRPELGDSTRVAWWFAAFLGYPVLSIAVIVLVYGVARTLTTS